MSKVNLIHRDDVGGVSVFAFPENYYENGELKRTAFAVVDGDVYEDKLKEAVIIHIEKLTASAKSHLM